MFQDYTSCGMKVLMLLLLKIILFVVHIQYYYNSIYIVLNLDVSV